MFTHWMACGARSFCPEGHWRQTHAVANPEKESDPGRNPVPGVNCRIHVAMMYLPLGGAIAIALAALTTAKIILEGVSYYLRKAKAFLMPHQEPEAEVEVSMAQLNSGMVASCPTPTLPLPTSPDRLRLPTSGDTLCHDNCQLISMPLFILTWQAKN